MFTALTTALILAPGAIQVQRVQVFDQIKFVAVAGAPTGSLFAVAQENGQVRLMNAATRSTVHQLVGHPQPAYGLAFTPNGQQLVTGDETSRIFVWDVRTGRKLREFPRGTMSHARGIQAISFSRDGRTMITTGKGRLKKNSATKASAATTQCQRCFRAFFATRCSACSTMASTAACTP